MSTNIELSLGINTSGINCLKFIHKTYKFSMSQIQYIVLDIRGLLANNQWITRGLHWVKRVCSISFTIKWVLKCHSGKSMTTRYNMEIEITKRNFTYAKIP